MPLEYTTKGKVRVSMHKYMNKQLAEMPLNMNGMCKTHAALHLLKMDEGAKYYQKRKVGCPTTWWRIYLCRRTCQDIQTDMALLCTRVQAPDVDDLAR